MVSLFLFDCGFSGLLYLVVFFYRVELHRT